MKAEDYIFKWCQKTYGGGKELGDWTTAEVMKFANDFHKYASKPKGGFYRHIKTGGFYNVISFNVSNKSNGDQPTVLYMKKDGNGKRYIRSIIYQKY